MKSVKGLGIPKGIEEVEVCGSSLEEAVAMIKKATEGTKPLSYEICAKYTEDND
jgi:hypothetical protein